MVSAVAAIAAGLADANLPLESGRSRGDEHTAAGAESGLGQENDARLPVGTSGAELHSTREIHEDRVQTTSTAKVHA